MPQEDEATTLSPSADRQELPAVPAVSPPKPRDSRATGGFLGGLAGSLIILSGTAAGIAATWPYAQRVLLGDIDGRLAVLEKSAEDLSSRLNAAKADLHRNAGGDAAVQGLVQRVAELESRANGLSADQINRMALDFARLKDEIDSLRRAIPPEGTILRLAERAESAEKTAHDIVARHTSSQALLLVIAQLRDAVDRGQPFDAELRAARRVATPEDADALAVLAPAAEEGVARKENLIAAFPPLAADIVRAAVVPPGGPLWQRAAGKLASLVSLRRIDGQGSGTQAVVARAEAKLKEGDLAKAAQELAALDGPPRDIAASWIKAATIRAAADRALSALAATAAAQTAKNGE